MRHGGRGERAATGGRRGVRPVLTVKPDREWATAEVTNHSVCPPSASVSPCGSCPLASASSVLLVSLVASVWEPHASVGTCHHVR